MPRSVVRDDARAARHRAPVGACVDRPSPVVILSELTADCGLLIASSGDVSRRSGR